MASVASCVEAPSGSVTSTASAQRTSGTVSASAETPTASAMRSTKMLSLAAAASAAARSKSSRGCASASDSPSPAPTVIVYSTRVRSKRMPPMGNGSSAPSTVSTFSESRKPSATSSETYSSRSSRSCKSVMCSSAMRKPPPSTRSAVASAASSSLPTSATAAPMAATICASRPSTGKTRVETVPRGVPRLVATVAATAARSTLVSSASSNPRTPTMGNVTETAASSGVAAPTENATASRNLLTMSPLTSSERMVTSRCSEGADPSPSAPADWGRDAEAPAGTVADTSIAPRSNAAVTAKKTRERVRDTRIAPGSARRSSSCLQPCASSSGASETSPSWQRREGVAKLRFFDARFLGTERADFRMAFSLTGNWGVRLFARASVLFDRVGNS